MMVDVVAVVMVMVVVAFAVVVLVGEVFVVVVLFVVMVVFLVVFAVTSFFLLCFLRVFGVFVVVVKTTFTAFKLSRVAKRFFLTAPGSRTVVFDIIPPE